MTLPYMPSIQYQLEYFAEPDADATLKQSGDLLKWDIKTTADHISNNLHVKTNESISNDQEDVKLQSC